MQESPFLTLDLPYAPPVQVNQNTSAKHIFKSFSVDERLPWFITTATVAIKATGYLGDFPLVSGSVDSPRVAAVKIVHDSEEMLRNFNPKRIRSSLSSVCLIM
jgi:hypothetical protein